MPLVRGTGYEPPASKTHGVREQELSRAKVDSMQSTVQNTYSRTGVSVGASAWDVEANRCVPICPFTPSHLNETKPWPVNLPARQRLYDNFYVVPRKVHTHIRTHTYIYGG